MSIFSRKMRLLCLLHFKHFATLLTKVYEQLTFFCVGCFFLSVLWYDFLKKQIFPFLYNNLKTLSRLQLRFKIEKFLSRDNLGHPPVLAGKHTVT